jgi:hypothetical protein
VKEMKAAMHPRTPKNVAQSYLGIGPHSVEGSLDVAVEDATDKERSPL